MHIADFTRIRNDIGEAGMFTMSMQNVLIRYKTQLTLLKYTLSYSKFRVLFGGQTSR